MISVQEVADELKKEFGTFFSTEWHPTADVINYINKWARWIANQRDWSFIEKTTTITTTVPDQIVAIDETVNTFDVLDLNKNPIDVYEQSHEYERRISDGSTPYAWVKDSTFKVNVPWTYKLLHSVYPAQVSSLSDSIAFPDSVKDLLIEISLAFGFLSVKDDDNASTHLNIAKDMLPPIASRKTHQVKKRTKLSANYSF